MIDYRQHIIDKMLSKDAYSQWMGMELLKADLGLAVVSMTVRTEMCNGFGIAHGGISYALADSTLAFASNTYPDIVAVSIETSISHYTPIKAGSELIAKASEINKSRKIGQYLVHIYQDDVLAALFKGTVYFKGLNPPK